MLPIADRHVDARRGRRASAARGRRARRGRRAHRVGRAQDPRRASCRRSRTCSSSATARPRRAPSPCAATARATQGRLAVAGVRATPDRQANPLAILRVLTARYELARRLTRTRHQLVPVPRRFDRRPPERDTTRINERIRVPEVRVIGDDGTQIGVMRTDEALRYAQERDLDLVEVAPEARPPVCRVLDYSKYKYEQAQKQKAGAQAPAADHDPRDQVPPEDRRAGLRDQEAPRRALPQAQGQGQDHDHVPRARGHAPRARRR